MAGIYAEPAKILRQLHGIIDQEHSRGASHNYE